MKPLKSYFGGITLKDFQNEISLKSRALHVLYAILSIFCVATRDCKLTAANSSQRYHRE